LERNNIEKEKKYSSNSEYFESEIIINVEGDELKYIVYPYLLFFKFENN